MEIQLTSQSNRLYDELYIKGSSADFTLVVQVFDHGGVRLAETKTFHLHKSILVSCSEFFSYSYEMASSIQ